MTHPTQLRNLTNTIAALATFTASSFSVFAQPANYKSKTVKPVPAPLEANWLDKTITPVTNPLYFEDPRITSEIRPIFANHWFPNSYHNRTTAAPLALGGSAQVYAVQARYALTDRLALIATKDGYYELQPNNTVSHRGGWANLAAGFKYALIDDRVNQLIVTPGLTFEIPTGNRDVFQGTGSGEWNPFVSAAKGFGDFHITANVGGRIPNDFSKQTAQLHYSLQLDYYTCQYFIPFVALNGQTVLSSGDQKLLGAVDMNTEMSDIINFGATKAKNVTQITVGAGFRSKVAKNVDVGVSYEIPATRPVGLFESRLTADVIWRF